ATRSESMFVQVEVGGVLRLAVAPLDSVNEALEVEEGLERRAPEAPGAAVGALPLEGREERGARHALAGVAVLRERRAARPVEERVERPEPDVTAHAVALVGEDEREIEVRRGRAALDLAPALAPVETAQRDDPRELARLVEEVLRLVGEDQGGAVEAEDRPEDDLARPK